MHMSECFYSTLINVEIENESSLEYISSLERPRQISPKGNKD